MGNLPRGTPMCPHLFVTLPTFFGVFAPRCLHVRDGVYEYRNAV